MRAIIGIVPLYDEKKESIWMIPGYVKGIEEAGGIPIILPYTDNEEEILQAASLCDGFLFTGGQDVNPVLYGEIKKDVCGEECSTRDRMESILFTYAIQKDIPILGICRGIQIINVLCQGSLYQDLPSEYKTDINHTMCAPYDRSVHTINILKDTMLEKWFDCEKLNVNSYHHQAIKELGKDIVPMAISEDGLIEAICIPKQKFVVALQWHPELNYKKEKTSRILFTKFIHACMEK